MTPVRFPTLALTLSLLAAPAAAQTPDDDIGRASRLLAANWRPVSSTPGRDPQAAFAAACENAVEEMASLDAQIPEDLNAAALAALRPARGLIFVPAADNPAAGFVFASVALPHIASGLAVLRVADAASGRVDLTDAAGATIELQLGVVGGKPVMRVPGAAGAPALYVGCASSIG